MKSRFFQQYVPQFAHAKLTCMGKRRQAERRSKRFLPKEGGTFVVITEDRLGGTDECALYDKVWLFRLVSCAVLWGVVYAVCWAVQFTVSTVVCTQSCRKSTVLGAAWSTMSSGGKIGV